MKWKEWYSMIDIKVPDFIIDISKNKIGKYPSIIETDYYTNTMFLEVIENNNLLWSNQFYNGETNVFINGLIEFKNTNILFYFEKRKDEYAYKFFSLCDEKSFDSVTFYLNKFKKYKLIT